MPLIVVPTPIGNLRDITLRSLDALKEADIIACEDTRRTAKLLNHYGIRVPLISCHEYNERSRIEPLLERVEQGQKVVLVSDAGMPAISDPGYLIISSAIERNLEVDVLPGPSSVLTALLLSGLPPDAFVFLGFLPEKKKKRRALLEEVAPLPWTLIFYIPPHDLQSSLEELLEALGDRRAALVREMSKLYQETLRGSISCLLKAARLGSRKGELVLVVEGAKMVKVAEAWKEEALRLMSEKKSAKDVVSLVAERYGITKSAVKRWLRECADEEG